jgi:Protein of unknown function (DUF3300)
MRSVCVAVLAFGIACGTAPDRAGAAPQSGQPPGNIDQLLAPIALYPDQLLAQILLGASDPAKVTEFDLWLKANTQMKGTQLQNAAVKKGFDPSLVALALFPQVVSRMAEQIEWTTLVGQAFAADRNVVFASIQRLRHQAQDVGTLKSTPQQEISTRTTSAGEDVIVIEPANPQVVYVPQYNTQTVYIQAPTTTNVVVEQSSSDAVAAGLIGFTAGIAIGAAMDNNYYYGPYGWRGGAYMYNDAWNDYYDAREDARDDWQDHREDLADERGDRAENASEQRTDRRSTSQEQRTDRQQNRSENRPQTQSTSTTERSGRTGSAEARGYGDGSKGQAVKERSGGSSDAFSGYSSGRSERSSSARGQRSRSSSAGRSGGGRRR